MKLKISTLILYSTCLILVTSCGLFKKVNKSKVTEKTVKEVRVDSTSSEQVNINVSKTEELKDINTVITETTTKKTTKGSSVKVSAKKEDIKSNEELILTDSIGRKIVVLLDSLNLTIRVESPEVIEEVTTKKTEHSDKSKKNNSDSTSAHIKQTAFTKQEETDSKIVESSKESSISPWTIITMSLGGVLFIVLTVLGLKKFVFK